MSQTRVYTEAQCRISSLIEEINEAIDIRMSDLIMSTYKAGYDDRSNDLGTCSTDEVDNMLDETALQQRTDRESRIAKEVGSLYHEGYVCGMNCVVAVGEGKYVKPDEVPTHVTTVIHVARREAYRAGFEHAEKLYGRYISPGVAASTRV